MKYDRAVEDRGNIIDVGGIVRRIEERHDD